MLEKRLDISVLKSNQLPHFRPTEEVRVLDSDNLPIVDISGNERELNDVTNTTLGVHLSSYTGVRTTGELGDLLIVAPVPEDLCPVDAKSTG